MGNIRAPQFGVEKDENTLITQDPNAVLYVVTPTNGFIPVRADALGRLELAAGVVLSVSDIQIGAVEIKNHDTDDRVHVTTANEMRVESRLHDEAGTGLTSTLISGNQALDVNLVGFGGGGITTEADDDDIADSLIRPTNIVLGYAYDTGNTRWERLNQTGGSLDVNVTAGGGGPQDTDDGSIAAGQSTVLGSNLLYGFDGAAWERITSTLNSLNINIAGYGGSSFIEDDDDDVDGSQVRPVNVNLLYGFEGPSWERILSTANALHVDVQSSVLPTGAATETTQALLLTEATFAAEDFASETTLSTMLTLAGFNARINTLGQKLSVASTPVVLASDQSAISVSQNGTWNINNISGIISLPTGAATQATLATLLTEATFAAEDFASETTLSLLNGKFNSLGQKIMTGSVPVVLASDHSSIGVTVGNFPASQTVDQGTHDSLNLNANIQIGDADVSVSNPVPIQGTIANAAAGNPNPVVVGGRNVLTDNVVSLTTESFFGHEHLNTVIVSERTEFVTKDMLFGFEQEFNLPSTGVETPAYLLRNPIASGKSVYISFASFGIDSDKKATFRIYVAPTVTVTGTSITLASQNVGGSSTPVLQAFTGPTVSPNGTGIRRFISGVDSPSIEVDFDFGILIQAGNDILITGKPSANNVLMFLSLEWGEV